MRRILMALMGTVLGTTLLVGLKAQGAASQADVSVGGPLDPGASGAAPAGPGQTGSGVPGQTPRPGATGPGGATSTGGPAGSNPSATTPAKTTAPAQSRTITGSAIDTTTVKSPTCGDCSGNMQVRITVTGTHIDSIQTIQVSNRPLNTVSILTSKALAAQSANVGNVSGATYSSLAWEQSLQSAINQI